MELSERALGYERVVTCYDAASGLRAVIAIYSTACGPALGGTRFFPYRSATEAMTDVLDLSRAMAYKNACAGLPFGGGKAVIIGDPAKDKTEAQLRAFGRFVQSLGGLYITACDVGTKVGDMDVIAEECGYVTGRSPANGGAGDSGILTAYGVYQAIRAATAGVWGAADLNGKRVGVSGVGKTGSRLVDHLLAEGASVVIADVDHAAVAAVRGRHTSIEAVEPSRLAAEKLDIYAPCALGGILDERTIGSLQARVVCGAANNQLATPDAGTLLHNLGITYVPDYVANAGGVIQLAEEFHGYDETRATVNAAKIYDTTERILRMADDEDLPPTVIADRLAEERMSRTGNLAEAIRC